MKKQVIAVFAAFILSINSVFASILGTEVTGWSHKIANGTDIYKNEFMSEQSGVGMQTEYYAKYTPNTDVLPTVIGGNTVWGLRNIKKAEDYMKNNGLVPLIGINASFFSFQTGIPMGVSVAEGRIITKDTEQYQAVGFNSDGTAFIAPLKIETTLKTEDAQIEISHINKYNQDTTPIVNLYTEDFDENNHNEIPSLSIILGDIDGNLGIGETLNAVVEDKFNYTGAVLIPKGKLILTLNENSDETLYEQFNSLEVGDLVEISSYVDDKRWNDVDSAMGSVGDRLIENGNINSGFAKGAAPRTAVGITAGGEIIFYVLDGRQKGYSYGAQIATIAKRLKELGCVDAINLDGGGSTAISGIYPGASESEIINLPSEGQLRNCSNYLFLKNVSTPTNILGGIYLYPFEQHYLSGYSEQLTPKAVDSSFYPVSVPKGATFSVSGESSYDENTNTLTANGTGLITVTASFGDVSTQNYYHSYETPTDIIVKDSKGDVIKSLDMSKGETVTLNYEAWYKGIKLKASQDSFKLSLNNDFGEISGNTLKITSNGGGGVLSVSAGERIYQIPVNVKSVYSFSDILNNWARDKIQYAYEQGIVSGYETESGLSFLPLKNITREEFAVIMCRMLGVNVEYITECKKEFADIYEISDWSRPYVYALVNKDIIAGRQGLEGKIFFSPRVTLTRAEAITILSRVLNLNELSENKFADDSDIPEWAKEAVYSMCASGFINGYPDNTILPNANVTRAEAAAMICNIISKSF
ncbi:MAG: phosphodiester glycosidase family protein [Firmicutes bacterium]|nr:phosphodiester glycosidase family protein [Bacillota bacterium]